MLLSLQLVPVRKILMIAVLKQEHVQAVLLLPLEVDVKTAFLIPTVMTMALAWYNRVIVMISIFGVFKLSS